ncbi:hypothetical protein HMPREF0762_01055 [Slackia exigua ATCC 700122]|uniref:Uncharacterized protein n=1 Tax=Slackia exigua (strain ATCC 700122 / DSM 15923 / CIP 105133 / JCM 11022 / KCTC 5966 / S-7) TaxID=649764 RepID=D0WGV1_SLAES|nr:hypothetical protein HMPREF0762_01055 [Slackia exigua ATCC 700122]
MKHFDEIYGISADNFGLVTAAQARSAGYLPAIHCRSSLLPSRTSWNLHQGR